MCLILYQSVPGIVPDEYNNCFKYNFWHIYEAILYFVAVFMGTQDIEKSRV